MGQSRSGAAGRGRMCCALGLLPRGWEEEENKEKGKKKKKGKSSVCKHQVLGQVGHSRGPTRRSSCGTRLLLRCASASGAMALLPVLRPKAFGGKKLGRKDNSALPHSCAGSPGILPGVEAAKSIAAIMCTGKKKNHAGLVPRVQGARVGARGGACSAPSAKAPPPPPGSTATPRRASPHFAFIFGSCKAPRAGLGNSHQG